MAGPASLWRDTARTAVPAVTPLPGAAQVDVAIVGGGYTGLWTAYYLSLADPSLRIVVLEKNTVGFGASGRNGGWCSAIFPASMRKMAALSDRETAGRMQRAMNDTVVEVGRVAAGEGIECGFQQGGYVSVARNEAQWTRAQAEVQGWRDWGFGDEQIRLLDVSEAESRVRITRTLGGTFTPHCAVIQPLDLVRGLANVVRSRGVMIYEATTVTSIESGVVRTDHGDVRADVIVRGTEGFTPSIPGAKREIVPMYSLMVATEPLTDQQWSEVGLASRETFSDKRHLRIYGQRTEDGRIAFGGRGAPYHFGSKVRPEFDIDVRVHKMLRGIIFDMFPTLSGINFTHEWGGNLGIPRDWVPSANFDRKTGIATAGGYVGDGVATSNIAGRTLRDAILGVEDSPLLELPWAGRTSRRWEPEPIRWAGVNAVTALFANADRTEVESGKPSIAARQFWRVLGH
ncbi:MAG: FAD-dependent oxidoreductase [Actinomycetes bacterium]